MSNKTSRPIPSTLPSRPVEIVERTTLFQAYVRLDRYRLRHALFGGGLSPIVTREVVERGHAVGVLPYDPVNDTVMLIEQFRAGALAAGRAPWLIEIVAGMVEPGEAVEAVARREAEEEAGLVLGRLETIADILLSPGIMSETIALYCGEMASDATGGLFGIGSEGEDIRAEIVPARRAFERLRKGEIANSAAVIALQWLALNRNRLRRKWRSAIAADRSGG